jgi:hypothetical protein
MEEIGVKKLYIVISQPPFKELQTVVAKLYREVEERKKEGQKHD